MVIYNNYLLKTFMHGWARFRVNFQDQFYIVKSKPVFIETFFSVSEGNVVICVPNDPILNNSKGN